RKGWAVRAHLNTGRDTKPTATRRGNNQKANKGDRVLFHLIYPAPFFGSFFGSRRQRAYLSLDHAAGKQQTAQPGLLPRAGLSHRFPSCRVVLVGAWTLV